MNACGPVSQLITFAVALAGALVGLRLALGRWPWSPTAETLERRTLVEAIREIESWRRGCGCDADTEDHPEDCPHHTLGLVERLEVLLKPYRPKPRRVRGLGFWRNEPDGT